MPRIPQASAPIAPQRSNQFDLGRAVRKVPLDTVGNSPRTNSAQSQMARVIGVHHRSAHSNAISVSYDIMAAARDKLSRSEQKAMDRTLTLLGPETTEHFGNLLLMHLTALGAMHASLATRIDPDSPDPVVMRCMKKIEKSLIEIGIKAGRCTTVPDGGYHGDSGSDKLTDAMKVARQRMLECAKDESVASLLERVASAILPGPLMASIEERQRDPGRFLSNDRSADPMEVLQKQMCDDLEKIVQTHIDSGGAEHLIVAILDILKLPEYVLQGDPGRTGEQPGATGRDAPPQLPQWALDDRRAPIAYNNVRINNDFADLVRHLNKPAPPLNHVNNVDLDRLIEEMRRDAYTVGNRDAQIEHLTRRNEKLEKRNEKLEERSSRLERQYDQLLEKFLNQTDRLNVWSNGPGVSRVPDLVPKPKGVDNGNDIQRQDAAVQTDPDVTRDHRDSRPLRNASTPTLPPEGTLRRLDDQRVPDRGRAQQTPLRADGNGDGGPRNNTRAPDPDLDTSRQNRSNTALLPPDGVLRDLNRNQQNDQRRAEQRVHGDGNGNGGPRNPRQDDSRNRLGGTQQLDQRQRNEQNRQVQQNKGPNRPGGTDDSAPGYHEYTGFLQAAGYQERTEPRDEHEPPTERRKDPNVVEPSAVEKYVKERSARAGTPYVPATAKRLPPVVSSPGRFNELIQLNGAKPILPSFVAGKERTKGETREGFPALPEKTALQIGTDRFVERNKLKAAERARRDPGTTAATSWDLTRSRASAALKISLEAGDRSAVRSGSGSSNSRATLSGWSESSRAILNSGQGRAIGSTVDPEPTASPARPDSRMISGVAQGSPIARALSLPLSVETRKVQGLDRSNSVPSINIDITSVADPLRAPILDASKRASGELPGLLQQEERLDARNPDAPAATGPTQAFMGPSSLIARSTSIESLDSDDGSADELRWKIIEANRRSRATLRQSQDTATAAPMRFTSTRLKEAYASHLAKQDSVDDSTSRALTGLDDELPDVSAPREGFTSVDDSDDSGHASPTLTGGMDGDDPAIKVGDRQTAFFKTLPLDDLKRLVGKLQERNEVARAADAPAVPSTTNFASHLERVVARKQASS